MNKEELILTLDLEDDRYEYISCNKVEKKGTICKSYNVKLSYIPENCYLCREKNTLIKYGFENIKIQMNTVSNKKTYLAIKKQRLQCKCCNKTFSVECKDHYKHHTVSKGLARTISSKLVTTPSAIKQIANDCFVSPITVYRQLNNLAKEDCIKKPTLPNAMCIDEFRGVNINYSKMNCVIADWEKSTIINVLTGRRKEELENFFKRYCEEERSKVKFFICDMFEGYISIAKKLFDKSKIIIDRFHSHRLIKQSLLTTRTNIMNGYKKNSLEYRVLKNKKFKKLLTKPEEKIKSQFKHFRYFPSFNSEKDVIDYILSLSPELEADYHIYQGFLKSIYNEKDINLFLTLIKKHNKKQDLLSKIYDNTNCSNEMKKTLKTFRRMKEYIINSIIYNCNNGVLEGMNNKIKVLKRNAYGFRNFYNCRMRIILNFNYVKKKKKREIVIKKI